MPWLDRNQPTDLLAVAEAKGGATYATVCLLGLNGLRVAEACSADIDDLTGTAYQPMLHIIGKGDRPATYRISRSGRSELGGVEFRPISSCHPSARVGRHPPRGYRGSTCSGCWVFPTEVGHAAVVRV